MYTDDEVGAEVAKVLVTAGAAGGMSTAIFSTDVVDLLPVTTKAAASVGTKRRTAAKDARIRVIFSFHAVSQSAVSHKAMDWTLAMKSIPSAREIGRAHV